MPGERFGEFVRLTREEYQALAGRYGEDAAREMIEILDNYKGASGKTYRSDYRAILSWVVHKYEEERRQPERGAKENPALQYPQRRYAPGELDDLFE